MWGSTAANAYIQMLSLEVNAGFSVKTGFLKAHMVYPLFVRMSVSVC